MVAGRHFNVLARKPAGPAQVALGCGRDALLMFLLPYRLVYEHELFVTFSVAWLIDVELRLQALSSLDSRIPMNA